MKARSHVLHNRSIHVVLRNETVDRAKPGDKVVFTGTLVVVPDVRQMSKSMRAFTELLR
jgi:DNA replicative helicase MCM subunit Mcm2 (Cdc46/Mcm family)